MKASKVLLYEFRYLTKFGPSIWHSRLFNLTQSILINLIFDSLIWLSTLQFVRSTLQFSLRYCRKQQRYRIRQLQRCWILQRCRIWQPSFCWTLQNSTALFLLKIQKSETGFGKGSDHGVLNLQAMQACSDFNLVGAQIWKVWRRCIVTSVSLASKAVRNVKRRKISVRKGHKMKDRKTLMKHRYNYGAVFVGYITFIGSYALRKKKLEDFAVSLFFPRTS